jgi:hypothetical protein
MWHRRSHVPLAAAVCALGAACANNPAPGGWLPKAQEVPEDPYGAWVQLRKIDRTELGGEFIAIHGDTLFVLSASSGLVAVHRGQMDQARLAYYSSNWGVMAVWTTFGSLATISNGAFLVITLPLWLIAGPIATGAESRAPLEGVRHWDQWRELRMYARFPQGIPDGLDRRVLRPRPL